MSGRLVGEVFARAPADLSPAELLVLVALAEQVRDERTRDCWPGMTLLCWHTRMSEDAIRKAFQRLARRGIEVRVSLGTDRRGRPIFAHQGKRTRYRIPEFVGSASRLPSRDDVPTTSRDDVPTTEDERRENPTRQGGKSEDVKAGISGPSRRDDVPTLLVRATVEQPSSDLHFSPPATFPCARATTDDLEIDMVSDAIDSTAARELREAEAEREAAKAAAFSPNCEHGRPVKLTVDGEPVCPQCAAANPYARTGTES